MPMSKVRVQLDLSKEEVRNLDALRDRFGSNSRSDAVRAALAVLDWVAVESQSGRRIYSVSSDFVAPLPEIGPLLRASQAQREGRS